MIRCALYDRVSTAIQVRDGLSLDAQRKALISYANAHGYRIVGIYTDEGISARKKKESRRELMRLLSDVQKDLIDLILVTKLDRWFRNIKDYHNTQAILEAHNCNWKTIFEQYDTSTSNGRFAINIMLSVNENECDRDSDRIKEVFRYKISDGQWLGGRPPFGYRRDDTSHLVKDADKEHIVNELFSLCLSSGSKTYAADCIHNKYLSDAPQISGLRKIFSKEIYTGVRNGARICEPYITSEQYNLINSGRSLHIAEKNIYIFSGLLKCPICGRTMTGHSRSVNGRTYRSYRCGNFGHSFSRRENLIEKNLLDSLVLPIKRTIRIQSSHSHTRIQNELSRLNILFQKGRISDEYYEKEYSRLHDRLSVSPASEKEFTGTAAELYYSLDEYHKLIFWRSLLDYATVNKDGHTDYHLKDFCTP